MNFDFFNTLSKQLGAFGVILGVSIMGIFWLFVVYRRDIDKKTEQLLSEKDKEIKDSQEREAKVTLVLKSVDQTMDAVLINLQNHR